MSSILDALERIEATGGPRPPAGSGGGGPERRRPWLVAALIVIAVAAGAGGAALVLRGPMSFESVATPPAPEPAAVAKAPTTLPTVPPTSTTLAAATPPAEPAAIVVAPHTPAPVPPPLPDPHERPWGSDPERTTPPPTAALAVARATPPTTLAPPRAAPAAIEEPPARAASKPPPGAPRLRVSFLVYSSLAERRSVALTINEGGLTTLREGDEAEGLQVVRIRPDRVELRWQGETFTLEVRS